MDSSTLTSRNAPSTNDQLVPVTSELLERLDDEARVGDVLTRVENGKITGFWRAA